MAILAVVAGGLPACRNATRTASPHCQTSNTHPSSPHAAPTRTKTPGRRWRVYKRRQPQRMPPPAADDATKKGERAEWFAMRSSSVQTVSRFLRHLTLDPIVSENVKMRGPQTFIVPSSAISAGRIKVIFPIRTKFPPPRMPESDVEQANDRLRRMAILAVSEGGLPACRNATPHPSRIASLPTTPLQLPNRPDPTEKTGKVVAHFQAAASRRGPHCRNRRPKVLTVSQFLRHLILDPIVSQNVKMRGPTPNT